eukprot:TRINITY_DN17946_c0_g4_i1.p1 TRINITY_DN17946_c0_g4~~TRINITY_DN17946_c0_g4_i1.p1  ORF type:complete len:117 (-),score=8.31 TRINITY_DN17946_c0_g4_i1:446-754(-)
MASPPRSPAFAPRRSSKYVEVSRLNPEFNTSGADGEVAKSASQLRLEMANEPQNKAGDDGEAGHDGEGSMPPLEPLPPTHQDAIRTPLWSLKHGQAAPLNES